MNDNKLIKLYKLNKDGKYFDALYKKYDALKYKLYSKKLFEDNLDFESDFNLIFLYAVEHFDENISITFQNFLFSCIKNRSKYLEDKECNIDRLSITSYHINNNKTIKNLYNDVNVYCKSERDRRIVLSVLFENTRVEDVSKMFDLSTSRIYSIVMGYKRYVRNKYGNRKGA